MRRGLALASGLLALALAAAPPAGAAAEELLIGYVALKKDPRYTVKRRFARYLTEALGSPYVGAKVAIEESKFAGSAVGVEFKLKRRRAKSEGRLVKSALKLVDDGAKYLLVDAPAALVDEVARATGDMDVLLFNITARDDVPPAGAVRLPPAARHPEPRDDHGRAGPVPDLEEVARGPGADRPAAGGRAAHRGVRAVREAVRGGDRRATALRAQQRPQGAREEHVALLTASADYDVVFVADTDGEFARDVPYQTVQPRLVVGSEGLAAAAWHWAWERHGAPQLEKRFQKKAKRPMRDFDWAAWMAVKAVVEAVLRTEGGDFAACATTCSARRSCSTASRATG